MSKVVGDIAVTVGADVSGLLTNMQKARRETTRFGGDAKRMSANFVKASAAIAVAAAAMGAALLRMQSEAANAAVEIGNLSRIANATPREFQRVAAAAEAVNISQQKMSDILKDVNDRIGDFLETGGGPMADFFENIAPLVGVTADEFARLSGPEALQLYVTSLERAGVSQQQMTFYLEAMASDATALLPLLRDNGAAMQALGDRAERVGRVLSNETIQQADQLKRSLDEMSAVLRSETISALIALEDELAVLHQFVLDYGIPALEGLIRGAATVAEKFRAAQSAINETFGTTFGDRTFQDTMSEMDQVASDLFGDSAGGGGPVVLGGAQGGARGASSGGGGSGSALPDLERRLATERELVALHYEETMAAIEAHRQRKLDIGMSYDEAEIRALEEKNKALENMDRQSLEARNSMYSGALGDLAALTLSGNKELFRIGKIAASSQAIVDGHSAATSAWSKGMAAGGPPLAAAFLGASVLKTGSLIAAINSASFGGGSSGGSASGAASTPVTPQVSNQVALSVDGDFFTRDTIIRLINGINEAQEDGAIVRLVN